MSDLKTIPPRELRLRDLVGKTEREAQRAAVWAKCLGRCWYCGTPLDPYGEYFVTLSVEHIHPRHHGGDNSLENLLAACKPCNSAKGAKLLEEYRWRVWLVSIDAPAFRYQQIEWLVEQGYMADWLFWGEKQGISDA